MSAAAERRARINPIVLGLVLFFIAFNFTVDRYWVSHAHELPARAATDLFAQMFQTYAVADHGYYDKVTEAELALETVNSTLTQGLNDPCCLWRCSGVGAWRVPLQIAVGDLRRLFRAGSTGGARAHRAGSPGWTRRRPAISPCSSVPICRGCSVTPMGRL